MISENRYSAVPALATKPLKAIQALIAGRLVSSADGRTRPIISPIDESVLGEMPECGLEDVQRAAEAARAAFDDRRWRGLPPKERKKRMLRWADLIEAERLSLAVLQSRDMGMPIRTADGGDLAAAVDCIRWYAEAIDKLYDEIAPSAPTEIALIRRVPIGVVAAIVPWNFPAMIAAWKLGPALAIGNSVILKPGSDASLVVLRMGELALEAGLPEGVLNVLTGSGASTGAALARHPEVDAIAFTGSGAVGRLMMQASAESNLKRVTLECGGKSANIIMSDAPDLADSARAAVRAMFNNQGQVCNAPARLLVQRPVAEEILESVAAHVESLKVGNPLDPTNDLGPLVNARQLDEIRSAIARGESQGARFIVDGRGASVPAKGFYLGPSVAVDVQPGDFLEQEELFGPVLSVVIFDELEEAIKIANGTRYGLGAAVWSSDIEAVQKMADRLVAGQVIVNGVGGVPIEVPFGGFRQSGFGRDRSLHAFANYSDLKSIILRARQ